MTTEATELAFLGFGVLRPFQRDAKSDFAHGGGKELLNSRIGQILGTKADSASGPGELPWRTDFGSRLHLLRHRNNSPALVEVARAMIVEALGRWERNIAVTRVEQLVSQPRALMLRVGYRLVDNGGTTLAEGSVDVTL